MPSAQSAFDMQIEECSLMTSEVRIVCEALKKKIAATTAA
jgi:hypothetical protein